MVDTAPTSLPPVDTDGSLNRLYRIHVDELRSKILDTLIMTGAIVAAPLAIHIVIRDLRLDGGFSWQMMIQICTYLLVVSALLFGKRISYRVRAITILSMLLISAFVGLFRLGVFSFAPITIFTCVVLSGILLNSRVAVGVLIAVLCVHVLFATFYLSGFWGYAYPVEEIANSFNVWIGWIAAITTYAVVTVICIFRINRYLRQKIVESEDYRRQLIEQNHLLQHQALELEEAQVRLEKAIRVKDEFLGLMSHELRTPVNPILGMTCLLETSLAGDPEHQERLQVIRVSAERLLRSIDQMLDITSMDNGSVTCSPQWTSMDTVLECLVSGHEGAARNKGLSLLVTIIGQNPWEYWVDGAKVVELLGELLHNAILFTERGEVSLELESLETGVSECRKLKFTIRDQGIGMREDSFSHLQELFTQLDSGRARRFSGLGLGLTIVARLASLMEAEVRFQSKPGEGTVVTVELEAKWRAKGGVVKKGSTGMSNRFKTPIHILVGEDDEVNRIFVQQLLKYMDANVTLAVNGEDVIHHCTGQKYDVILMDVSMPIMDGIEATGHVRKSALNGSTPIIGLSAHNLPDIQKMCHEAGMNDYILKPVTAEKILEAIQNVISSQSPAAQSDLAFKFRGNDRRNG